MWADEAKWKRYFGDHGREGKRDEVAERGGRELTRLAGTTGRSDWAGDFATGGR
jgi:hypothetical protein